MNRKETTRILSKLLVQRKLVGKYASEVTLDLGCGKGKEKRADFVQFVPKNQSTSGIEKGEFIFYEVKSCKETIPSWQRFKF